MSNVSMAHPKLDVFKLASEEVSRGGWQYIPDPKWSAFLEVRQAGKHLASVANLSSTVAAASSTDPFAIGRFHRDLDLFLAPPSIPVVPGIACSLNDVIAPGASFEARVFLRNEGEIDEKQIFMPVELPAGIEYDYRLQDYLPDSPHAEARFVTLKPAIKEAYARGVRSLVIDLHASDMALHIAGDSALLLDRSSERSATFEVPTILAMAKLVTALNRAHEESIINLHHAQAVAA